ncbi:MAG: hypothetical protein ACLQVY_14235 [Limisphaerales bacterium]
MNSEFEKRLQDQPMREVPSDWRARILETASSLEKAVSPLRSDRSGKSRPRTARRAVPTAEGAITDALPWWRQWLWPCPRAWAGLAAAWILILGMDLAAGKGPARPADVRTALSRQELRELRQQQQMLAELIFAGETAEAEPPKAVPSPRSERSGNQAAV